MKIVTYRYQANPRSMGVGFLFCVGAAAGTFAAAIHNDSELTILGLFKLMPQVATILYLGMALVLALLALIALIFLIGSLLRPNVLTLTSNELWVPKNSFSRMVVVLNLAKITSLSLEEQNIQKYLHISIGTGRVTLIQSFFSGPPQFSEACRAISEGVARIRGLNSSAPNEWGSEALVQPALRTDPPPTRG